MFRGRDERSQQVDLGRKDTDGRPVKIAGHEDWLEWKSDPDDLLVIRGSGRRWPATV